MVTDHISDLIIQMKNAGDAGKESLSISHSKMKEGILQTLKRAGFIKDFEIKGKDAKKSIDISLAQIEGDTRIAGVERMSKLSKRTYVKAKDLKPVKNGFGALIVSTPKGIMSEKEARKENVGGEPLFKIW
jgi:small subunit ribosomal protein S8